MTWNDNSEFETSYHIYRDGQKIAEAPAFTGGTGEYTDTNRGPNTTYEYKVIAYHQAATLAGVTSSVVTPVCPPDMFTLTTNTTGSGTVLVSAPGPYTSGTQVELTAKPDAGWHFVRWESSADLGVQATQLVITVTVTDNVTYTAHFEQNAPDTFTLTTNVVGDGSVSISAPGPYTSGTHVQLTAKPDDGWHFVRWESSVDLGDQATQPVITVTVTVTVTDNVTYTAHFEQNAPGTFTLTTNVVGDGSVSISASGPYTSGTQVQLTAKPDAGWHFVRWESSVSLGNQAAQATITVIVTGDATYTAYFEKDVPPSNSIYLPLIE